MKIRKLKISFFDNEVRSNVNNYLKCKDFTSPMDVNEKLIARYKLAVTIQKIISNNTNRNEKGLATSLRKLAASSQTEYAIIQKITSGKKDPQFTTLAAIIDGLEISFSEFSQVYDSVTEKDIQEYKSSLRQKSNQSKLSSTRTKVIKKKK